MSGLFLGLALITRPLVLLIVMPILIFLFVYHRSRLPAFFFWFSFPLIFMLVYSYSYMGFKKERVILSKLSFGLYQYKKSAEPVRPLLELRKVKKLPRKSNEARKQKKSPPPDVQKPQMPQQQRGFSAFMKNSGLTNSFIVGLAGILISPARGLFIYSPLLLLSFIYMGMIMVSKRSPPLWKYLSVSVLFLIILVAKYQRWWGGWTFGYRLLIEITPILIIFLALFWYQNLSKKRILRFLVGVLLIYSLFVQFLGVYYYPSDFCFVPDNIDQNPARLWDYRDTELTRCTKLLLLDVGLISDK